MGKSSKAGAPDPRLADAQIRSMGLQDEAIQAIMAQSREMAPLQRQQMQFGLDAARTAYDQSQEDRAYALTQRAALTRMQDRMTREAEEANSEGRITRLQGEADSDVDSAFSSARGQMDRGQARMGITPGSGRAVAMNTQMTIAQAGAKAAAANKVRAAARAEGLQLTDRAQAALAGFSTMGSSLSGAGAGYGGMGLDLASRTLAGLNSGYGAGATVAGQMGSNATGMWGAQASYKNAQDQIRAANDPFNTVLGAAAGVGAGAALKKFGP